VGQKELVNIEGVICDRLHTDVKYESEKILHMPGYGVPGELYKAGIHVNIDTSMWELTVPSYALKHSFLFCNMYVMIVLWIFWKSN